MVQELYSITKKDLFDLFGRLSESHRVIVPYAIGENFFFSDFDPGKEDNIELGGIRQGQPLKAFLNYPRKNVLDQPIKEEKPVIIAGVKGCDLSSLLVQDYVFQDGECKDPFYARTRQNTVLIGADCTFAKETCFCLAMNGAPYPKKYYDINLSVIGDNFIAETGSPGGAELINSYRMFFNAPGPRDLETRRSSREKVSKEIQRFMEKRGTKIAGEIKGVVKKNYDLTELWKDLSSTCVECGACNLVCPTCHCFLLFDQKKGQSAERYRIWDSCLYNTFARVAGGANPRRHLYERLRNRFDKKFDFFPQVLDYYACTGCGRCIDACPGDIDIREVLKGLVLGKWNKPPHD